MMAITDIFAAVKWWAVLSILGLAALPLTTYLLGRLPDKGYAFSKMVGLLLVSYIFWLLGSLGVLSNSLGSIVFSLIVLLVLSGLALRQSRQLTAEDPVEHPPLKLWLRQHLGYIVTAELVFLAVFAFWIIVRSQNPSIASTEKPMDFAFLNSSSRSQSFPPLDPWLSGFAISYYYFGYLMTSVISRLAFVPEFIGFNLAIAWLAAGTALGSFGLVYNLISAGREKLKRQAVVFGLVAALAIPVAGNMEILLEVIHGSWVVEDLAEKLPVDEEFPIDFWTYINVRDLEPRDPEEERDEDTPIRYQTSGWWWWRSSRVINEHHISGSVEQGLEPIAEFPAFSFILGDLHPHVLALPFALLSLAVAYSWFLSPTLSLFKAPPVGAFEETEDVGEETAVDWDDEIDDYPDSVTLLKSPPATRMNISDWVRRLNRGEWLQLVFTALVLGGLSFLNTWDVLIHLFVIVGAFVLGRWREDGRWSRQFWIQGIIVAVMLVIPAVLLYLPFYFGFRSQAGAPFLLPMTMRPTRLLHFFVIFGLPLSALTFFLGTLTVGAIRSRSSAATTKSPWLIALAAVAGLILVLFLLMLFLGLIIGSNVEGAARITNLATDLGIPLTPYPDGASFASGLGWSFGAIGRLIPQFIKVRLQYSAMTLFLSAFLISIIVLLTKHLQRTADPDSNDDLTAKTGQPNALPFVLLLVGTAVLLTLGPEFVYLKDVFSQRLNTIFKFYYQAWILFGVTAAFGLSYLWSRFRIPAIIATAVYGAGLAAALLFPVYAAQSRSIEYRGVVSSENRQPPTLNGLAWIERFNEDEYDAIMWLRENIEGSAVILEAVGGSYSPEGHARVSANTGIPTVLGWPGHERQWRGVTPEPGIREPAVSTIYSLSSWPETAVLLNQYDVTHIYFGRLERSTYNAQVEEKFDQNLEVAYQNGTVKIYRWQPQ